MPSNVSNRRSVNLINTPTDIVDTSYRSTYFTVAELDSTFTAGKNLFSFNGSSLLKRNSPISLEILDSSGTPLYYEIGKSGYELLKDTTDLVVSIHVDNSTSYGFGYLTLLGVTVDNKTVKWTSTIKIAPDQDNFSRVIFFETPTMEAKGFLSYVLNEHWTSDIQQIVTTSGSILTRAVVPAAYSDLDSFDSKKIDVDYRLTLTDTESLPLTEQNGDVPMELHIKEISLIDSGVLKSVNLNSTQSVFVKEVVNNKEIKLKDPIFYTVNNVRQIVTVTDGYFIQTFNGAPYITSSGVISDGSPDGSPDPTVFLVKPVGLESVFVKECFLDVTYNNLKTLTGKIHRHKIYRRSLNKASEFECISDEPLRETETLYDTSTANRTFSHMGKFYNQFHVSRYVHTSSLGLSILQSSDSHLNSATLSSTIENLNGAEYAMFKNDTSILTISSSAGMYVTYDDDQDSVQEGSAYDSNFIRLYKNTDYLMSADVDITKMNPAIESRLVFYFTGSYNTSSTDPTYEVGRGIKLHEYILPVGTNNGRFSGESDGNVISFKNDRKGTLVIVPINILNVRMSNLSLKSFSDFGFSPDMFSTRICFPVTMKNEQYELRSEFFDIHSQSIYSGLRTVVNLDPFGESLFKNITNYLITDSNSIKTAISSGSLTISASRDYRQPYNDPSDNRATLTIVESFAVMSGSSLNTYPFFIVEHRDELNSNFLHFTGSASFTGSLFATASWSTSSSFAFSASAADSSSASISSSYTISASAADSSSASISSSYSSKSYQSLTGSHLSYVTDISIDPGFHAATVTDAARIPSGFLTGTMSGVRIWIPYYYSITP